jgi:phage protein D
MSATTTLDAMPGGSPRFESFFVPSFTVSAGPRPSALRPLGDVQRVSYRDTLNQIDAFDFTVSNRGWALNDLRLATRLDSATPDQPSLLPGAYVRLSVGYRGGLDERLMMTGRVVGITPSFAADGAATLTVRALSSLEALQAKPETFRWRPAEGATSIRDSEIAQRIGARHGIEVLIPAGLREAGYATITQSNETDIGFLMRRARERGYIVAYREVGGARGAAPARRLYFGPSNLLGDAERTALGERTERFLLGYGNGLTDFRPTLSVSTALWRKVKLSFWDRRTRRKVPIEDTLQQLWREERGLNQDLERLVELAATAEHELTQSPVHTAEEGRALCRNQLRENFLSLVTADGGCVGMPELRAAGAIEVRGVGEPFSGTWRLTSTTHTIDDSGYRTAFSARREQRTSGG